MKKESLPNPETFRNPGKEFRSLPFFSWNDELEAKELARQIAEIDRGGWGGFFIHSRPGLITPYLGKEWMEAVRLSVAEAKQRGMAAWLYDEDKWPSGYGGGLVPNRGPEYRNKALVCERIDCYERTEDTLRLYACRQTGDRLTDLKQVKKESEIPRRANVFLRFRRWTAPLGNAWFNGTSYADLLDPKVVDAFLESTFEAYRQVVGDEFGDTVPGIFTDEPSQFWPRDMKLPALPWTDGFPRFFKRQKGYAIEEHLPSLFLEIGDYHRTRYDFWSTVTKLFVENYTRKLFRWCTRNHLALTGHLMDEGNLLGQMLWTGSTMPHYEYMHIPGVDHLGRNVEEPLVIKQCASVAQQLGSKRVLTELYGCSGQNLSFKDQKWIADWHFVLGVNLLNHHVSLYSMRGARKRDFPPNLFWQQPWWEYNRFMSDYTARVSSVLTQGERVCDILVIHPMASAWTLYAPGKEGAVRELHGALERLCHALLSCHWDFELGDEMLMAKYAEVDGSTLNVGNGRYAVVILPPAVTLSASTVRLLQRFLDRGGKLIAIKPLPTLVDGRRSGLLRRLWNRGIVVEQNLPVLNRTLEKTLVRQVNVLNENRKPEGNIWYHRRRVGTKDVIFLTNTDPQFAHRTKVEIKDEGALEIWDAYTGEIETLPSRNRKGFAETDLNFAGAGSALLVLNPSGVSRKISLPSRSDTISKRIPLGRMWSIADQSLNALTLDFCRCRVNDRDWSVRVPVWKARQIAQAAPHPAQFALEFSFQTDFDPVGKAMHFVVETPGKFQFAINGQKASFLDEGHWADTSFRKTAVGQYLVRGENRIILTGTFEKNMELENCYVVGEFGVKLNKSRRDGYPRNDFVLLEQPTVLHEGNWIGQGYPFLCGSITVQQNVSLAALPGGRAYLEFQKVDAIVLDIRVNGKAVDPLLWEPWEREITGLLKAGQNRVEVKLVNSLRNLLGPHHHRKGELVRVNPGSFSDESNWVDSYAFVPFGFAGVSLAWKRE